LGDLESLWDVATAMIGAHALAFHVEARLTEDLGIFVEPSAENGARIMRALDRFGFGAAGRKKDLVDLALLEEASDVGRLLRRRVGRRIELQLVGRSRHGRRVVAR
jgi:hypothetical protein